MTPQELKEIGEKVYNGYGWQVRFAKAVDVTPQTVNNWVAGRTEIPVIVQKFLSLKKKDVDKN